MGELGVIGERLGSGSIHVASNTSYAGDVMAINGVGTSTSAVWPTINLALFFPFGIDTTVLARQMSVENGATVNGNVDVGIYDERGIRLVSSGSTAQAGTSTIQLFDITDTLLKPGNYFMAIACSSITATFARATVDAATLRTTGVCQQATAIPLPAPATLVGTTTGYVPNLAMHFQATV